MKRKTYLRKLFVCANVILIMACVLPVSVKAQCTLKFRYNKNTQSLNIQMTPESAFPGFLRNQNVFAKELEQTLKVHARVFIHPQDSLYCIIWPEQAPIWPCNIPFNSKDFDSVQCSELKVFLYDEGKVNGNKHCKVEVLPDTSRTNNTQMPITATTDKDRSSSMGLILIIIAVAAIAAVAIWWFLKQRNQKDQKSTPPMKSKDATVEVMEVVEESFANGLDAVREDEKDYYLMDMQQDFADTAVHKIYLHHTAIKKMYDFFKTALESSDQTTETGCYFVGCWEYATDDKNTYNISVEDIVEPGDDIVSGEFSFNFGLKIGVKLFSKISDLNKRTHRDFVHTVWMHSHPGLGLFLSSHDLLVQQQLTYSDAPKRLVAFVIDTNTPDWDLAVFTTKNDGTMNNKDELRRLYSLETLYKWSRDAHASAGNNHEAVNTVAAEQKNKEDYYPLQVNNQGNTKTSNAFFSGKAINAIDDILYNCAGKATIGGYVEGTCDNHGTIWIEDCTPEPVQDALGIIVVDAKVTDQSIATEYVKDLPVLCVLVCRSDDELLVLTRNNTQEPFTPLADSKANPMTQIKEWLRRRRIYK